MLYPNGYININQNGEYTKHYYADALRIASKIGSGASGLDLCSDAMAANNNYFAYDYLNERVMQQYDIMRVELNEVVVPLQDIQNIDPMPHPNFCSLGIGGQEPDLFFYHPDHLGSTGMVTDNNANITQGFLYTPFGELLYEYDPSWESGRIPKYAFNAKELDEENNMYYYSARYYAPPTFISRDPLFEKYPSISPYTYCSNNPVGFVDPTGGEFVPPIKLKGLNNSSVTIETDLVDMTVDMSSLGIDFGGNYTLAGDEILQAGLDLIGIVDPSGIADGVNAFLQAKDGKWGGALLSGLGLIPYVGDLAKAGKVKKDIKVITNAVDAVKAGKSKSAYQAASGKATDKYGNVIGPSGKPQVNTVKHSTQKQAKDAARNEGKGAPVKHTNPSKGESHYHSTDKSGNKNPNSTHHEY
jgi:RHS repeat-associated protein